jgi:hypothetical protein
VGRGFAPADDFDKLNPAESAGYLPASDESDFSGPPKARFIGHRS